MSGTRVPDNRKSSKRRGIPTKLAASILKLRARIRGGRDLFVYGATKRRHMARDMGLSRRVGTREGNKLVKFGVPYEKLVFLLF